VDCNSLIPGDLYLAVGLFIFPLNEEPQQTYLSVSLVTVHVWQMILIYFKGENMTRAQGTSILP